MDDGSAPGLSFWKVKDPRSPLGQARAVALMRSDKRASYKHLALLQFHWEWAHVDYDWTSLASVRKINSVLSDRDPLEDAPLSLPHISMANRDLCDWGWLFELEKGSGRKASRFIPNFAILQVAADGNFSSFLSGDLTFSVNPPGEHKGFGISVYLQGNASVTYEVNANRFCVYPEGNKDPSTVTRLKDGVTEIDGYDCAPASPPPPDGLGATGAGRAQDGFEQLWHAYGHRQKKSEARAAYLKSIPDAALHARMVDAAKAWFAAWAAQGKADAPRFTLAKWIERQEYDCDPPTAYKPKQRKSTLRHSSAPAPAGRYVQRHVAVEAVTPARNGYEVKFAFEDCEPGDAPNTKEFYNAENALALFKAVSVDVRRPGDERNALGRRLTLVIDEDDQHTFEPVLH